MSKRIDAASVAAVIGTMYPPPFDEPCRNRERRRLGDAAGLKQFGVNLLRLPPGSWSSQRHWHSHEDEFVYVLSGEVTLVSDSGTELLRAGDAAGFPGGVADGHCLQNRGHEDCVMIAVSAGDTDKDYGEYPDIDLRFSGDGYLHKDGTPYPPKE